MSFIKKIIALLLVICFILPAPSYAINGLVDDNSLEGVPTIPGDTVEPAENETTDPPEDEDEAEEEKSRRPFDYIYLTEMPPAFITIIEAMNGDPAEQDLPTGAQYEFPIDEIGPTVVVLLHGKTSRPERAEGEGIDSILHPYHYWGFGFVRALLNPGGRNLYIWKDGGGVEDFDDFKWRNRGLNPEEMDEMYDLMYERSGAIIFKKLILFINYHYSGMPDWRTFLITATVIAYHELFEYEYNSKQLIKYNNDEIYERKQWLDNEIDALVQFGKSRLGVIATAPTEEGVLPGYSVMLTYRDGSRSLGEQSVNAVNQIYDNYQKYFGHLDLEKQPKIVLVAHSMGGLVSRYILTNPTEHVGGHTFTQLEREKADFIRDRTRYLATLATPHEGSPMADLAFHMVEWLHGEKTPLDGVWSASSIAPWFHADLHATAHLRIDYWNRLNLGPLAPDQVVRTDGTLVPIYAITGRTPTSGVLDDPSELEYTPTIVSHFSPLPRIKLSKIKAGKIPLELGRPKYFKEEIEKLPARCALEAEMCMLGDFLVNLFMSWGDIPSGVQGEQISRIRRVKVNPFYRIETTAGPIIGQGQSESLKELLSGITFYQLLKENELRFPAHQLQESCDSRADNDSLVSVASGVGFTLGTNQNEYFSHEKQWPVDGHMKRGSWYRFYEGSWDLLHHGSIKYRGETGEWLRTHIITQAGPYIGPGPLSDWIRREFILEVDSTNVPEVNIKSNTGHGGSTSYNIKGINLDQQVELQAQQRKVTVSLFPSYNIKVWYFTRWSGSVMADEKDISLVMDEDMSLTAHYKEPVTLRVASFGAADVTIESITGHGGISNYTLPGLLPGETVTLEVPQYVGSGVEQKRFVRWSGAVSSANRAITFFMYDNKSLIANYIPDPDEREPIEPFPEPLPPPIEDVLIEYTMEIKSSGTSSVLIDGGFINPHDGRIASRFEGRTTFLLDNLRGRQLTLTAPEYVGSGESQFRFELWTGKSNVNPNISPLEQPTRNFDFESTSRSINIDIPLNLPLSKADAEKIVTAHYVPAPETPPEKVEGPARYTLTVNSTGDDQSGVDIASNTGHKGKTNYQITGIASQAKIHLEAPEYLGSGAERKRFSSWSGAVSSSNRIITLEMDNNKTVTANYIDAPAPIARPRSYTLTVTSSVDDPSMKIGAYITSKTGHGGTTPYTITGIEEGTQVHLEAGDLSDLNGRFVNWSGSISDKNISINFTMDSNKKLQAHYWYDLF